MPCACVPNIPKYPSNEEWGPLLWGIFHILAEKSGSQTISMIQEDERRTWPLFIRSIQLIIPCPECREHFGKFLLEHPFETPKDYTLLRNYVRIWFYTLHEEVSARLGKPSFPFENLSSTYSDTTRIKTLIVDMDKIQKITIQAGVVTLGSWNNWLKHFKMLRAAFGI
jgi:hypothetical protein